MGKCESKIPHTVFKNKIYKWELMAEDSFGKHWNLSSPIKATTPVLTYFYEENRITDPKHNKHICL